jgi:hypothetical protein
MKGAFGAIFASPRDSSGGISPGSSTYWPGTVKMAAKATVAMRQQHQLSS